jgi:hypothetical protein
MMIRPVRLLPLVAALLLPLAPLRGDTITLDDGRVLEGDLLSPDDATVIEIRVTIGGLVAVQRFDRRHILAIHHGMTEHQSALASIHAQMHGLGEGGTAEAWLALARAARDQNESGLMRELAAQAALRDRHNLEAHRLAGEVLQNGVWMLPREAAVARGEVFFDGHWMPWSERADILAEAAQARASALAARKKLLAEEQADAQLEASQQPTSTYSLSSGSSSSGCEAPGYYYGYSGPIIYGPGFVSGFGPGGGWGRNGGGVVAGGWGVVIRGGNSSSSWNIGFHW